MHTLVGRQGVMEHKFILVLKDTRTKLLVAKHTEQVILGPLKVVILAALKAWKFQLFQWHYSGKSLSEGR